MENKLGFYGDVFCPLCILILRCTTYYHSISVFVQWKLEQVFFHRPEGRIGKDHDGRRAKCLSKSVDPSVLLWKAELELVARGLQCMATVRAPKLLRWRKKQLCLHKKDTLVAPYRWCTLSDNQRSGRVQPNRVVLVTLPVSA